MMSTQLESIIPYAVGFGGFVVLAVVALGFLEGTMRWMVLGVGVMDAIITPILLKKALNGDTT